MLVGGISYFESKFKVRLSQGAGFFGVTVRVELQADLCIGLVLVYTLKTTGCHRLTVWLGMLSSTGAKHLFVNHYIN